jgi:hypothetical protein
MNSLFAPFDMFSIEENKKEVIIFAVSRTILILQLYNTGERSNGQFISKQLACNFFEVYTMTSTISVFLYGSGAKTLNFPFSLYRFDLLENTGSTC